MNNFAFISFFMPSFNIGGVEKVLITYANILAKEGFKIDFIVCQKQGELLDTVDEKINIIYFNKKLRASFFPLYKYLKTKKPDILISGPDFPNFIAIFSKIFNRNRTKLFITQHNFFNTESKSLGIHGKLLPILIKTLYPFADKIIAVSNGIRSFLINLGIHEDKIVVIYNPIDIKLIQQKGYEEINIQLPKKYIVYCGRISQIKNLNLLLDSFNIVSKEDYDLHLIIVGNGLLLDELSKKYSNNKIHFIGALTNPYPVIRDSKLLILSSLSESFSMVIAEALTLGTNVVSTPTLGPIELLGNGKYGFISQHFNLPEEFADLIKQALKHPFRKESLQNHAKYFDINESVKRLKELF